MARHSVRPVFLTLWQIHFPWSALASITHRLSGLFMALSIPLLVWILNDSLASQESYDRLMLISRTCFILKFIIWSLGCALLYHLNSGIRHVFMDLDFFKSQSQGQGTALFVFGCVALQAVYFTLWFWSITV